MSDLDIISSVEQYPILWDSRLREFKDKTKQRVVWMMIAEKLNMTADQVIHRWTCIRRQFVRKNRPNPSGSGTDEIYQWDLYKYTRFLAPVVRHRKTINNAPPTQPDSFVDEDRSQSSEYYTPTCTPHTEDNTSHPSTSFSPFENNTPTYHTTTNNSEKDINNSYEKTHINTEELDYDDDENDDLQFSQNTTISDTPLTQKSHNTYNRDTQHRQPLLLRLTPAINDPFPPIPFQNRDNQLSSPMHHQTPRYQKQTPKQQSQTSRPQTQQLHTPRQSQTQLHTPKQSQTQLHTPRQSQTPRQTLKNNKRKLDDKLCKYLENTENYLTQKITNDDEDICFFKGTLSIIKEFSPNKKFRFKQEYMNLLAKFKDEV